MRQLLQSSIFIFCLFLVNAGCSVATPSVRSLLSNFNTFRLTNYDLRINNLSSLSNITITANCDSNNLSFEYELTDLTPGVWPPVPATPSGIFNSINNQCSSTNTFTVSLNLSSTSPFSTMPVGATHRITFRDIHTLGISQTEEFRITYSYFTLSDNRLVNGQGLNSTLTGPTHILQGRIINRPQLPIVSGSGTHSLQGKALFE